MREATSVNKGWVVVGLILLVSGLAGFQVINSPAYAQLLENGTVDSSQVDNLPSNLLQNQLSPDQNSLIATPGPTSDELSPPQNEPSVIGGDEGEQQTPTPNSETLLETTADEQNQDTGETIGNSIVQNPVPDNSEQLENSQPGVSEQNNQPRADDDNDNSAREGERGNQEAGEATDGGDEEDEEEEEEEDEEDAIDSSREEIPSSLRNWLPFP